MSRLTRTLLVLGIILIAVPTLASAAAAHSGTLKPNFCHVRTFNGGGTWNSAVTHTHKNNDVYQIICEPGSETCWAWSFNTGNGGTILTAGLTSNPWEWLVCTWATNKGKTKYQGNASLPGADTVRLGEFLSDPVELDLGAASTPAGLKDLVHRLGGLAER